MVDKRSLRRRFLGGGVASLAIAGALVILLDVPAALGTVLPIAWLAVGGAALLVAATRERVSIGPAAVGWPRVAAAGLALLALGSSTFGFVQLLEGTGVWGLLNAGISLLVALVLAFVTLECAVGGVALDEETFAVE